MGKGKKGKMLFSVLGFAFGAGWLGGGIQFGATNAVVGGLYGASLAGTLWSTVNKPKQDTSDGGVQRFDKVMNTCSSTSTIPVIYGERKWGGNQTYHKPNPELNMLRKHVILCEGGIQGVKNVSANDLILPVHGQSSGTVFTVQNVKHTDANIAIWRTDSPTKNDKCMRLYAGGQTINIVLAHYSDAERDDMFQYNCDISSLVSYINKIGNGWQAYPYATTKKSPEDIYDINGSAGIACYNNPIPARVDSVRGGTTYTFNDCATPDTYQETGGYKNCAWVDLNLAVSDELNGNPNITALIQGKKVLDLRNNKVAYSTNPAMCLLDFLMSERYGIGIPLENIDIESFKEAADWCDQLIDFKNPDGSIEKAKRYELNMIIDSRKPAIDWLGDILSNFCGYIVINNDTLGLRIERATPATYHFDESIISGEITIVQDSLSETPNKYETTFTDPLNNWNSAKCIIEDTASQKHNKITTKSVELTGVTSQHQALRLTRFYRDLNTVCNTTISFSTAMQAMHLECGDVITVSWYDVFDKAPWRIIEIEEGNDGKFKIKARQYNASVYGDHLGASLTWYDYTTLPNAFASVHDVTNLDAVEMNEDDGTSSMLVTFKCLDEFYRYSEVYMMTDNPHSNTIGDSIDNLGGAIKSIAANTWTFLENAKESVVVKNIVAGTAYSFKVVATNRYGIRANFSTAPTCTVNATGYSLLPRTPAGFELNITKKLTATWNSGRNVTGYEVWSGETKIIETETKTADLTGLVTERQGALSLYAVNENGRSLPATIKYDKKVPEAPESIKVYSMLQGVIVNAETFPPDIVGMNIHMNDQVVFSASNYYSENYLAGLYDIRVAFVDVFGEGLLSKNIHLQLTPTIPPELIEAESISLEKMDGVIKDALQKAQDSADAVTVQKTKDSLTAIVRELDKPADECGYTAIAQTNNAVQLRAEKDKLISLINVSPEAITIDGKYVHITGDTVFDENVIVGNMLAAKSITADKIDASVFTLTDHKISANGVVLDSTGMKVIEESGAYTQFNSNGITWISPEGYACGAIRRTVSGSVPAGKYVRLNWTKSPIIIMSLRNIPVGEKIVSVRCFPTQVTKEGFRANLVSSETKTIYGSLGSTGNLSLYIQYNNFPEAYSGVTPAGTIRATVMMSIGTSTFTRPGYPNGFWANVNIYRSHNYGGWGLVKSIRVYGSTGASIVDDSVGAGTYRYKAVISDGQFDGANWGCTSVSINFTQISYIVADGTIYETPIGGNIEFIAIEADGDSYYTIEN